MKETEPDVNLDKVGTYSMKDTGPDDMIAEKNSIYYTLVYANFTLYSNPYSLFLFYYDEKNNMYTLPYTSVNKGENIETIVNRYTKDFIPSVKKPTKRIDNYILYDISDVLNSPYMGDKDIDWKWLSPFEIINYQQFKRTNISKVNIDFFMNNQALWKSKDEDIPIIVFKGYEEDKVKYYNNSKVMDVENMERCIFFYDDVKLKEMDEHVYDEDSTLVINDEYVEILNNTYLLCLDSI